MSAWIEIGLDGFTANDIKVALFMSAWIEMFLRKVAANEINVALFMSAWIEMVGKTMDFGPGVSHSSGVRGLKSAFKTLPIAVTGVALFMSAWIEILDLEGAKAPGSSRTLHECVDGNSQKRYD